jgi:hypothetical protein
VRRFTVMGRALSVTTCSLALLFAAGCTSVPVSPPVPVTGNPIVDGLARREVAPPADRALWDYRVGAAALRHGQWEIARERLDAGLALAAAAGGAPSAEAARSRRMFRSEAEKPFIGEPYERVMANFYRGVLYWADGDPENARALFRNGLFIDSDTVDKTYAGDWVLLEYLDGYITRRQGGDGSDARRRAEMIARRPLPPYDPSANVLVLVEYGRGPRKYAAGEHGELLRFSTEPSRIAGARLQVGGQWVELPPMDDLHYQATTRGGRVMDAVLGNKAVFKTGASNVGDVALFGAIATHDLGRGEDKNEAALALVAVGLLSKLASAATQPSADTRAWDNLPQYLSFTALRLEPGEHPAIIQYLNTSGAVVPERTQTFTLHVPAPGQGIGDRTPRPLVVFKSEVPN